MKSTSGPSGRMSAEFSLQSSNNSAADCVFSSGNDKNKASDLLLPMKKTNSGALAFASASHKPTPQQTSTSDFAAHDSRNENAIPIPDVADSSSVVEHVENSRQSETIQCLQTSKTATVSTSNLNNNIKNDTFNHYTDFPEKLVESTKIHRSYSMLQFNEMQMIHSLANDDDETDSGISLDDSIHIGHFSLDISDDLSLDDEDISETNDKSSSDPLRNKKSPNEAIHSIEPDDDDDDFFFIGGEDEDNSLLSGKPSKPSRVVPRQGPISDNMGMRRSQSSIQFPSSVDDLSSNNKTLLRSGLMVPLDPLHEHDEEDDGCDSEPARCHLHEVGDTSSQVIVDDDDDDGHDHADHSGPCKEDCSCSKRSSWKTMKRILSLNSLRAFRSKKYNLEGDTNSNHDRKKKKLFEGRKQIHSSRKINSTKSLSSTSQHYHKESLSISLHTPRNLNLGLGSPPTLGLGSSAKVTPSPDSSMHEIFLDSAGEEKKDESELPELGAAKPNKVLDLLQESSHSNGRRHSSGTTKPLKSCMKKASPSCLLRSHNLHKKDSEPIASSVDNDDSQSQTSNKSKNTSCMKRVTSFSNIEIREYDITIGDTIPKDGPPIAIGWNYDKGQVQRFDLEYYEETRPARRSRSQMYMGSKLRMFLLMKDQGLSAKEIEQAAKNAARVRRRRNSSNRWDSFRMKF